MTRPSTIPPERYELLEEPFYAFEVRRRDFIKAVGGGLAVFCVLGEVEAVQDRGRGRRGQPDDISAWLHIAEDGQITGYAGKVEIGQDIRTSLTQVVAEELRVGVGDVQMVLGDTDLTPYDMGTWGSRTTPTVVPPLRRAAAAAREMLIDLAAERWQIDRGLIEIRDGHVTQTNGRQTLTFGELTRGEKLIKTIEPDVATTAPNDWKVCGKPAPKVNARDIVTGAHQYCYDLYPSGMLHGKVLRPSAFNGTISSINLSKAEAIDGVRVVRDGDFVGVTAPDEATALRAVTAIEVQWTAPAQPSHRELYAHLKEHQRQGGRRGGSRGPVGSMAAGLTAADHFFTATYTLPYIAHTPLEPRSVVAEWTEDGRLDVHAGTQSPFGVRSALARAFNLSEDRVRVRVPDVGSGYGGKTNTAEIAMEAARLARGAGRPVKVAWTREEEFTWAYFRPAGVMDIESGVTNDGKLTAWRFHNYNSGGSGIQTPYRVDNREVAFHGSDSPLRQGSYRCLAATANVFARESHMDEIAVAIDMDPLEFRLRNLENQRLRAVLEAAAERFGWSGRNGAPDRGMGLACAFEKGSYIATCVEVSVDTRRDDVRIERIVAAYDCGAIINPNNVENQVTGCIVMGVGGALFEAIDFDNGRILNPRLSSYRVPRFTDVPPIETILIDRKDEPSAGAGETPIVAIAPALGNAIFDAAGVRLRSLPMLRNGLKA